MSNLTFAYFSNGLGWNHQPVIVQDIFSIDPDLQPFNTLEFGPVIWFDRGPDQDFGPIH